MFFNVCCAMVSFTNEIMGLVEFTVNSVTKTETEKTKHKQ